MNLRPFNLEEAKAGKPVVTRDGRKVRLFCFDLVGDDAVAGAVTIGEGKEDATSWTLEGRYISRLEEHARDLLMAPVEKTVWVNVYRNKNEDRSCDVSITGGYESKASALDGHSNCGYIGTFPFTFTE